MFTTDRYKLFESLNYIPDSAVEEAEDIRQNSTKGRRFPINLALIAAVAAALALGTVAAAVGISRMGLEKLGGYFEENKAEIPAGVPVISEPQSYASPIDPEETTPLGEADIISVSCSDHFMFATVEYRREGISEIPEGARFMFQSVSANLHGISQVIEPLSREGDTVTEIIYLGGIRELPADVCEFTLGEFGYYDNAGEFVTIDETPVTAQFSMSDVTVMESKKALNTAVIEGIEFSAEITPLGVVFSCPAEQMDEYLKADTFADKYFSYLRIDIAFADGTATSGETDGVGLYASEGGWLKDGVKYQYYGFSVPIDADSVTGLTYCGEQFTF